MAEIKDVRIWRNRDDARIYVHTDDGREGVKYLATTRWHKRGEIGGELTNEEWQAARALAVRDNKWHNYTAPVAAPGDTQRKPTGETTANGGRKAKRGGYCPRCGHWAEAGNDLVLVYNAEEDRDEWRVYHTDKSVCEKHLAEARARRERKAAYKANLAAFRARFKTAEQPEGPIGINDLGEIIIDTMNVYGGGYRVTLDDSYVWLVENNGMDGDDWSLNNIRPWGAGAIGRRLPRTEEIIADARGLAEKYAAVQADEVEGR